MIDEVQRRLDAFHLHLNQPEPALIYRRCQYALQPSSESVSKHLGTKHQLSTAARRGLSALIRSLDLPDPNRLLIRRDGGLAYADLLVQVGAAYRLCDFCSINVDLVVRHVHRAHGLRRDRQQLRDRLRESVQLQSWTQNGSRHYWIVEGTQSARPEAQRRSPGDDGSLQQRRRLDALHAAEEERMATASNQIDPDPGTDDLAFVSNQMRRTDQVHAFTGADRRWLSMLTEGPIPYDDGLELGLDGGAVVRSQINDERKLALIGIVAGRFWARCEDTGRYTDHSLRYQLRSQIPYRPYKVPFELPARASTRVRYRLL